jgi:hyperosmotically inducible periplasmic protein
MRMKITVLGVVVVALGAPLQAQQQPARPHGAEQIQAQQNTAATDRATGAGDSQDRPLLGQLERGDRIIGKGVESSDDQRLGTVADLAVDMKNGRLVEVVIGSGGVLGLGEKYRAVPPAQLTCDPATKTLQLNGDASRFNEAPSFKLSDWDANSGRANVVEVYKYYNIKPYFTSSEEPVHDLKAKAVELGNVQRAEKLKGMEVQNLQGDRIGKLANLMVDLRAGRVAEVIVASGGFLGLGDEYSVVPPQSFRVGNNEDALVLDTSKETLANAPHFKADEWGNATNVDQVGLVYRSYNVEPYFNAGAADNTAQNVSDRNGDSLTPLKQGTSESDVDITRQIRKAIMAANNLSIDARNVKIITLNGHVTLRGPVKSQDEKQRIADIAATVTPKANIDNQIQVAPSPTASVTP